MKRGCHRPRRMRGASTLSQLGCWEIMSCINLKRRSGSFCTLTSTLNLTCWFSGCSRVLGTFAEVEYNPYLHKQLDSLFESGDWLFGFLGCPNVFHAIFSIPVSFFDFTYSNTAGALAIWMRDPVFLGRDDPGDHGERKRVRTCRVRRPFKCCNFKPEFQRQVTRQNGDLQGSWNITTTSSFETWTSVYRSVRYG